MTQGVYLFHIEPKFRHAGHYTGCSRNIEKRIQTHLSGEGVPLIRAALAAGHTVTLVRVWLNQGFTFEQHLKTKRKNSPSLCPICNPSQAQHLYQPNQS